jgi:YbgC/YbaW family acyl-CoA thioester hydrolase
VFACEIPIRFGDVDHARIVYYPHFFHFCHVAMEELFAKAVGVPYHELIGKERLGFPTVHVETDFEKTVSFGETLRMLVAVVRIGRTSVTLRFEGFRGSDRERAFVATITSVCVDMDRFAPVPIPDRYRSAFERLIVPASPGAKP